MPSALRVIGLMSGTSLDGLDICLAHFSENPTGFSYTVEAAETISYPGDWLANLKAAESCSGPELVRLHVAYGNFLGMQVKSFLERKKLAAPDFISSHGHTIFHQPQHQLTFQLGSGASLAAASALPVVCDFRSTDVALGGQGAPLVPVGDKLLFGEYGSCLNLGGFANISYDKNGKRIAFDICAVNYVMNRIAKRVGKLYDANGALAEAGMILPDLLEKLNSLSYYKTAPPKSLGREWVESSIFPLMKNEWRTEDLLRTFAEHIAFQISVSIPPGGNVLVTGGGAHNSFLIRLLNEKCGGGIVVPDTLTVDFKEALVFAFLGWLRWNQRTNVLATVTGASKDSCSGAVYF